MDPSFLREASRALAHTRDPAQLCQLLAELVVPVLGDLAVVAVYREGGAVVEHRCEPAGALADTASLHRVLRDGTPELEAWSLTVPVVAGGVIAGALLVVRSPSRPPFDAADRLITDELLGQVALLLENMRLADAARAAHARAERAAGQTDRLRRLTDELSTAVTPAEVARAAVSAGRAALGARAAFAWLLSEDGQHFDLVANEGLEGPRVEAFRRFPADIDLPICRAVRSGVPMLFESPDALREHYPASVGGGPTPFHAWAVAPFLVYGRGIGGVSLSFGEARPFRSDERALLAAMAGQASIALERSRLFAAERLARQRAERSADRAARLQAAAAALSRAPTSEGIAHELMHICVDALAAEWGVVGLLSRDGAQIQLLAAVGMSAAIFDRWRTFALERPMPMADAARTRREIWLESEAAVQAAYAGPDDPAMPSKALIAAPLVSSGRVIGSYALGFSAARKFDADDRELITALGQLCAQALDRARVYEAERRARAALETTNAKLEAIIQSSPAAIMLVDPQGRVDLWNPAAERTFGWTAEEVRGRFLPGVPDDQRPRWLDDLGRVGRGESVAGQEARRLRKDGRPFDAALWTAPVYLPDGSWRCLCVVVDITERKRAEEALAQREAELRGAYELARDGDRRKDEFLAMLGHELRNPLAPITAALRLLELRGDERSQRERSIIQRQVRAMERLVEDLLDVSRITRGTIQIQRRRLDLAEVVTQAVELAAPFIEEKGQRLLVDVPRGVLGLDGDELRLAQIIGNLLTNAAKFTPPGGEVEVRAERQDAEVVLRVLDHGAGIEPELLPRVFEMFTRGPTHSPGGLGVGLAIVQRLVTLHGGTVTVHSEGPGRGSEFVVRLPAAARPKARAEPTPPVPQQLLPARRVLVVDDNRDAADTLGELLSALGHEVRVAYDGADALAVAADFGPEVALLDIGLPGMDGYQLARELRERIAGGAVRLIAISGYGQDQDRARAVAAGFDRHLVKPVDLDALARIIEPRGAPLN